MKCDIGIIGGTGPIAGRLFFDLIIAWYQREKNAWQDRDFPSIMMISYPFSDMLSESHNSQSVSNELKAVIAEMSSKFFIIACNTLHYYGDDKLSKENWIHLMKTTAEALSQNRSEDPPLVLCTTTSRKNVLHQSYFNCVYPRIELQSKIDHLIETILKGKQGIKEAEFLKQLIHEESKPFQKVVLGCTELSLLVAEFSIKDRKIIDPAVLATEKVCLLLNNN